ncbi:hypothetical protein F2Q68_00018059 [Brassica cretica]|uniref:Uncharacterized protein n=1 Tax=Brassica cretica TaxID=69181 RepID=A0A8S9HDI9_BRACR|nr:hypothetical protein F2Q68_00018059 [Brassica cretica]
MNSSCLDLKTAVLLDLIRYGGDKLMLKMISITRKTMEEHKLHLDSFIGTWDEFGRPGGRGLVVITVEEACLWVDESLEPYLTYFT